MRKPQATDMQTTETSAVVAPDTPVAEVATAPIATDAKPARPTGGGSFVRRPDGSLERVVPAETTKEA